MVNHDARNHTERVELNPAWKFQGTYQTLFLEFSILRGWSWSSYTRIS
jgi:hypothetical protein